MHKGLIEHLAKYGVDSYAVILEKMERLVNVAGLTEEEAAEDLERYYKQVQVFKTGN